MTNVTIVSFDNLRSLGFASTSSSYVAVGPSFAHQVRLICFTNNTDGDILVSDDGVNDKLFVAANSFKLFDLATNKFVNAQYWVLPIGTQFYIKRSSVPTKGSFYIECLWGENG